MDFPNYSLAIFFAFLSCLARASDVPVGHMKPFGFHWPPTVQVQEYTVDDAPNPKAFFENHVKHSKAAIFRGAMKDSDAYKLWTDEYLRENFGDMEIRLEGKKEKSSNIPTGEKYLGRDTVRHFVDNYHDGDSSAYAVSDIPFVMYHDVGVIPSLGACGEMSRHFVETDIWWSGGDGHSIIHKDAFNQMNCLLNGTKYWKLIEYKYEKELYKFPEPADQIGGFSQVNPQAVDLIKHPNVRNIEWSNLTLRAGDCLYLPKSYYHQVDSFETHNLAVSILFGRFDDKEELDFSDCTEETDYRKIRRLSEFDVMWIWRGSGTMVMGSSDIEDQFRGELIDITHKAETIGIPFTSDDAVVTFSDWGGGAEPDGIRKAYERMDKNGDNNLTEEEVRSLNWDDLRFFAEEVEVYEPSNSYEFEYSLVAYEQVLRTLKFALSRKKKIKREMWVKLYKSMGGTEYLGNDLFTRLAGEKSSVESEDVTPSDIEYALENWKNYYEKHDKPGQGDPSEEDEGDMFYNREEEQRDSDTKHVDKTEL